MNSNLIKDIEKIYSDKRKKALEKSDLNKSQTSSEEITQNEDNEILLELKSTDLDSLSPREALDFLYYLKNKLGE